jgi:hypothetical protein
VKARYDRGLSAAVRLAKAHLRYAVHRTNERGQRQYREVWDRDGTLSKQTAYERLDGAGPQDYVYRLTLSPHPERQDAGQRLELREWTRAIMARLEETTGRRVKWFAVTHAHPDHRHVHVVARVRGHLSAAHFRAMRETGDQQAREQQRQPGREPVSDRVRGSVPPLGRNGVRSPRRGPGPAAPPVATAATWSASAIWYSGREVGDEVPPGVLSASGRTGARPAARG